MKTLKRVGAVLLTFALAMGILTGCGGESTTETETEQNTEAIGEVAEAEEIRPEITDSWYNVYQIFGQSDYTVYYAVKVENTDTNHYWNSVSVAARLLDGDGNEIGTASEYISTIEPGTAQAVVGVTTCGTEPASVEFALTEDTLNASAEAREDYITSDNFEVSDIVFGEKTYGDISESLTGKLKNLSDRAVERVKYTILFTKDGKIVNAATAFVRDIEADGTGDMDTSVYQSDYDNYEIYLSATAAQ